jgi:hypothetical protein
MSDSIEIKLVETNFYTRWPCTVCGGHTEKVPVLAEAKDTINGGDIRICERCLECGDIDDELSRHADRLEAAAQEIRNLKGHLKVPSFQEWQAATDRHEAVWIINYFLEGCADSGAPIKSVADLNAAIENNEKVWTEIQAYPPNYVDPELWKSYATQDVIDDFWKHYAKPNETGFDFEDCEF